MNSYYESLSQDEKNDYLVGVLATAIGRGDFRHQLALMTDYIQREAYYRGVEQGRKEAVIQQEIAKKPKRSLLEILAETWVRWPTANHPHANRPQAVQQTSLGDIFCSTHGRNRMFGYLEIARDQDTAVVTEAEWCQARNNLLNNK